MLHLSKEEDHQHDRHQHIRTRPTSITHPMTIDLFPPTHCHNDEHPYSVDRGVYGYSIVVLREDRLEGAMPCDMEVIGVCVA
jgi:hypothetical protein